MIPSLPFPEWERAQNKWNDKKSPFRVVVVSSVASPPSPPPSLPLRSRLGRAVALCRLLRLMNLLFVNLTLLKNKLTVLIPLLNYFFRLPSIPGAGRLSFIYDQHRVSSTKFFSSSSGCHCFPMTLSWILCVFAFEMLQVDLNLIVTVVIPSSTHRHRHHQRRAFTFVPFNCATLLFDSNLFVSHEVSLSGNKNAGAKQSNGRANIKGTGKWMHGKCTANSKTEMSPRRVAAVVLFPIS